MDYLGGYDYTSAFVRVLRAAGHSMGDDQILDRVMRFPDVPAEDRASYWSGSDNDRSALVFRIGAQIWKTRTESEPYPAMIDTPYGFWLTEWPLPEEEARRRDRQMMLMWMQQAVQEAAEKKQRPDATTEAAAEWRQTGASYTLTEVRPPAKTEAAAEWRQAGASYTLTEVRRSPNNGGCYVATAVYGSYDCPEVRVLRRWRDISLARSPLGRQLIRCYYAVSPVAVRLFGKQAWFSGLLRRPLDGLARKLQKNGYTSLPYTDA